MVRPKSAIRRPGDIRIAIVPIYGSSMIPCDRNNRPEPMCRMMQVKIFSWIVALFDHGQKKLLNPSPSVPALHQYHRPSEQSRLAASKVPFLPLLDLAGDFAQSGLISSQPAVPSVLGWGDPPFEKFT